MNEQKGKFQSNLLIGLVLVVAIAAGVTAFVLFDGSGTNAKLASEYTYDIDKYTRIDPALITYRQVGEPIQTTLEVTNAIAVGPDTQIHIAGDEQLAVYSPEGQHQRQIDLDAEPTCVTVDEDGTIIVGLTDRIVLLNADGTPRQSWDVESASSDGVLLTSLAVDKDAIFAADAIGKVIRRYNRTGTLLNTLGRKDPDRNIPGFVVPSPYFDVAMAADGLLRAVNPGRHLIEAWTVDGYREWAWGRPAVGVEGFSGCCNPISFAILPGGDFITAEKGLVRIKEYDADGEFVGVVAGPDELAWDGPQQVCMTPEECSAKGYDVAVDGAGRVYVLDMVHHNIRIFEKK